MKSKTEIFFDRIGIYFTTYIICFVFSYLMTTSFVEKILTPKRHVDIITYISIAAAIYVFYGDIKKQRALEKSENKNKVI